MLPQIYSTGGPFRRNVVKLVGAVKLTALILREAYFGPFPKTLTFWVLNIGNDLLQKGLWYISEFEDGLRLQND